MNQSAEWNVKLVPMLSWFWPNMSQPKIPLKERIWYTKQDVKSPPLDKEHLESPKKNCITTHHEFSKAYFMGFWGCFPPKSMNPARFHPCVWNSMFLLLFLKRVFSGSSCSFFRGCKSNFQNHEVFSFTNTRSLCQGPYGKRAKISSDVFFVMSDCVGKIHLATLC